MSKTVILNLSEWEDVDERIGAPLRSRLPARVADAHAHLYRRADARLPDTHPVMRGPERCGMAEWRQSLERLIGAERLAGGLFLAFPSPGMGIEAPNRFLLEELDRADDARGLILAAPDTRPESLAPFLDHPRVLGIKPYHFFSPVRPSFDSPLLAFAPEWMWHLADERGLILTIHLVRDRALADEENWRPLVEMTSRCPRAKVILAHAARGFQPAATAEGVARLQGLDNVWFDTSAICEPASFIAILRAFGPRRLLFGTDCPIHLIRGKCVSLGDGFLWTNDQAIPWENVSPSVRPTLVGVESLRALFEAADTLGLNDADLQDIFADNLLRLAGMTPAETGSGQELYRRAKRRIPGGTQLLSKRPEMFAPDQWPAYFREARGCETWDLDGRRYVDMSYNGIGACILGFRDPDVTAAVRRRVELGSMCTLNPPEEVELADLLCEMHPWAERVRFGRTGGEMMAVAVRIARATTGRSRVAICGYHGWHDWYIAANLGEDDTLRGHLLPGLDAGGVPGELRGTTLAFHFNDIREFDALMDAHGNRLAAVVMEPCRGVAPRPEFLARVRRRTRACGAVWIIDEITAGFRFALGGAHLAYGATPDMGVFAKTIGNGHPVAAVIGTRAAMEGAEHSFISSTQWTESVGPVAGVATLRKMRRLDVPAHVHRMGTAVQDLWRRTANRHGLPVKVGGLPPLAHLAFDHQKADALRTLYTQWMLDEGYLASAGFYPTMAHTDAVVARFGDALDRVFARIAQVLGEDRVEAALRGPVAHRGFHRLT